MGIRGRGRGIRRAVIGIDGSAHSRRATAFLARLAAGPRAEAVVVRVLEPVRAPSMALMPGGVRDRLADELGRYERERRQGAQKSLDAAARTLAAAGWRVRTALATGVPVVELLKAVDAAGADLLVLGARGVSGLDRLLLGSVADAAMKRAPVPVLIVK